MISLPKSSQGIKPTRLQIVVWGAIMAVTLWLLVYDWSGYRVGTYGDDGSYIAATDSLVHGVPYGTFLDPENFEPTQFPFLFPLLLAPARALLPNALDAMRLVPLAATLGFLTVLFWGWRWLGRGLNYWWGLAVTALTALSPVTILHGRTIMSESVFLLFCLLVIVWVERVVEHPTRGWGIVLGLLAFGLVYTRTVGWIFLAVLIGYLLWKKRGAVVRQFGAAAATFILLLGIVLVTTTVRPHDLLPQEYVSQLSDMVRAYTRPKNDSSPYLGPAYDAEGNRQTERKGPTWQVTLLNHLDFADKLPYQLEHAVITATDQAGVPFLRYIPILLAILLVVVGAVTWVRATGVTALQLIAVGYLCVLAFWIWNGSRLVHPIQPQLFLALLLGIYGALYVITVRVLRQNRRWAAGGVAVSTVLVLGAWGWLDMQLSRTILLPGDQVARAAVLQAYLPPDAIVLSTRAETDYLYSPQTFVEVPRSFDDTMEIRDYMRRNHITFIVSHAGVIASTKENDNLRVTKVRRFMYYIQPLIENRMLEQEYFDAQGDLAIYRLDESVPAAQP